MIKKIKNGLLTFLLLGNTIIIFYAQSMEDVHNQTDDDAYFSVPLESLEQPNELKSVTAPAVELLQKSENSTATDLTEGSATGNNVLEPTIDLNVTQDSELDSVDNEPMPIIDLDATLDNANQSLNTTIDMDESETVTPKTTDLALAKETQTPEIKSTKKVNDTLSTIHIAMGSSFELPTLKGNEKYFVKNQEHKGCLTSTTDADGRIIYTLMIQPGMTTDHFTIFKGHGTEASQTDLRPAFHVKIQGLTDTDKSLENIEDRIEQAWKTQEDLDEAFLKKFIKDFDEFRKNGAKIWFNVDHTDSMTTHKNSSINDHLHLKVGETHIIATGSSATVQSNKPLIASGKIEHPTPSDKKNWNIVVTGNKGGTALIHYSIDGKDFIQPVIVQKELIKNY